MKKETIKKLLVLVLNKTECLEEILEELGKRQIGGATIIDSRGMVQELSDREDDFQFLGSLRNLLNPSHKENKTLLMVVEDYNIDTVYDIVNRTTGGLNKPDTGILFTIPIEYLEGLPR